MNMFIQKHSSLSVWQFDAIFFFFLSLSLSVNWTIHSKRSCPTTDSNEFFQALRKALMDMKDLYGV